MDINKNIKRTGYITKNHESFLYPALHKVSSAQVQNKIYMILYRNILLMLESHA